MAFETGGKQGIFISEKRSGVLVRGEGVFIKASVSPFWP